MIFIWLKLFHILFVISWMAGVLYLPRIIVNYKSALSLGEPVDRLSGMAKKLFKFSILTGLIALISGLFLGYYPYRFQGGWLQSKILLVFFLWIHFGFCGYWVIKMPKGALMGSELFWRIYNEVALILLIIILYLVVVKPPFHIW
ncbi:MAG: CopD family protein [SAR324 cluster bacterium]|nr:CopD family protein [SAR324 cluster bacterium]